jgi:hypothetical protein
VLVYRLCLVNDIPIRFWNCSDSVVFFVFIKTTKIDVTIILFLKSLSPLLRFPIKNKLNFYDILRSLLSLTDQPLALSQIIHIFAKEYRNEERN